MKTRYKAALGGLGFIIGLSSLGEKNLEGYRKELCKKQENCAMLVSEDYVYKIISKGKAIVKVEEYSAEDLETKVQDIPIVRTSTIRNL